MMYDTEGPSYLTVLVVTVSVLVLAAAGASLGAVWLFKRDLCGCDDLIIQATIAAEAGTPMAKLIEHDDGTREWVLVEEDQ